MKLLPMIITCIPISSPNTNTIKKQLVDELELILKEPTTPSGTCILAKRILSDLLIYS
jgi:hypothetical protein